MNNYGVNDTITFAATMAGQTITMTGSEFPIKKSVSIIGLGATNLSIVNHNGRVFHMQNGPITVSIFGLTLTGQLVGANGADGTFGAPNGLDATNVTGGCIQNDPQCTLSVSNCLFDTCYVVAGNGGNGYTNDSYGFLSNGGKGGEACGGAICNNLGDLLVYRCTFTQCAAIGGTGGHGYYGGTGGAGGAGQGGALCDVYGNQDILIMNCTFTGNVATAGFGGHGGDAWIFHVGPANGGAGGAGGEADGGAIYIGQGCPDATCTGLVHDTIDGNGLEPGGGGPGGAGINAGVQGANGANGAADGGGLYHANFGHVPINNTIIAEDHATFLFTTGSFLYNGPDVFGSVDSFHYNLIGVVDANSSGWIAGFDFTGSTAAPVAPLLGPLQYNGGGPTPTMAPQSCSPAIDTGSAAGVNRDQALQLRPVGITSPPYFNDGSDIGAYELQSYPTPTSASALPLSIVHSGNGVIISWPAGTCYVLQQTADLANPNWVNSPYPVNIVGTQKQVTISPANGTLFFRLFHP